MLPCNVTVEADPAQGSLVRIIDTKAMMQAAGLEENAVVAKVGQEAFERLKRVAEALAG